MRKVSLILFSGAVVLGLIGCGGKPATNNGNANTTPANSSNQNANVAANTKPDVPVPTFSDAPTALAEGKKYLDGNEIGKAIDALKQSVALDPDLAEGYFELGIAYAIQEDTKPGIPGDTTDANTAKTTKSTKQSKKNDKPAKVIETDSDKAFDAAVKAYKKILDKNPKDDLSLYNLARSYSKLNEDEDAEKALRDAIKIKPDDAEYQMELGATLNRLAKYDEAIKALKKAQSLDPENSQIEDLLDKADAGKKRVDFGKAENDKLANRDLKNSGKDDSNSREAPPTSGEVKIKPLATPKGKP